MLQYNETTKTWDEVGKQEKARKDHAIAVARVPLACFLPGNTSPHDHHFHQQGPTRTHYSNRTRIILYHSNPTRNFLKNYRVASRMYSSHFRKIAARPAIQNYSLIDTALVEILSFILSLSSATNLVFYIIFNFHNKQN